MTVRTGLNKFGTPLPNKTLEKMRLEQIAAYEAANPKPAAKVAVPAMPAKVRITDVNPGMPGGPGAGGPAIPPPANSDIARARQYADEARRERQADMEEGKKMGERYFAPGALGRVDDKRDAALDYLIRQRTMTAEAAGDRSDAIGRVMYERQKALGGMSAEEQGAYRTGNVRATQQSFQGQARDLERAQARAGVRGAAALAGRGKLAADQAGSFAEQERQLFLQNLALKREAVDKFEQSATGAEQTEFARQGVARDSLEKSLTGARAEELERTKYNLDRAAREKAGMASSELGYASMGAAALRSCSGCWARISSPPQ